MHASIRLRSPPSNLNFVSNGGAKGIPNRDTGWCWTCTVSRMQTPKEIRMSELNAVVAVLWDAYRSRRSSQGVAAGRNRHALCPSLGRTPTPMNTWWVTRYWRPEDVLGKTGAFWGRFGLLFGSALFAISAFVLCSWRVPWWRGLWERWKAPWRVAQPELGRRDGFATDTTSPSAGATTSPSRSGVTARGRGRNRRTTGSPPRRPSRSGGTEPEQQGGDDHERSR